MKAVRIHSFGPPEVMKLEEVSDVVPGPGQVVVAVKSSRGGVEIDPRNVMVREATILGMTLYNAMLIAGI